jgi:hypothetical protein
VTGMPYLVRGKELENMDDELEITEDKDLLAFAKKRNLPLQTPSFNNIRDTRVKPGNTV